MYLCMFICNCTHILTYTHIYPLPTDYSTVEKTNVCTHALCICVRVCVEEKKTGPLNRKVEQKGSRDLVKAYHYFAIPKNVPVPPL